MSVIDRFPVDTIRRDFPALHRRIGGRPLVYLDSAASSLKPRRVIETLTHFYSTSAGSTNRGVHHLAREASNQYEEARRTVADLIGADEEEILFVRNATEALNLVAHWCKQVRPGRVVTTVANHHSNYLPWMHDGDGDCVGVQHNGVLSLDELARSLEFGASLLCLPHVSNAMGSLEPAKEAIAKAHEAGALVLLDGAQSVPHMPVNVKTLGCDFLAFSGHKMLAPLGIGVLYAKRELLDAMPPVLWGGDMVEAVTAGDLVLRDSPERFEAGTPNAGGAIALATAVDYLDDLGLDRVCEHVRELAKLAHRRIREIPDLEVYGPDPEEVARSAVSFGFRGMAAHALALLLSNRFGIMVRSGYHCAQPLHEALGLPQTVRASFYLYNTRQEVEALVDALRQIRAYAGHPPV